ncbi:ubiquitin-like protein [Parathielavia hyrcaniae]|uniref:Ubiquitin-like protein n=1 Tax=Parathielavia hyrcaniae TaxID=113614 RepID=A0AAN6PS94_9PEZI|nr:ubiquitin-like protein [Parathielavia hyrcaniae]
MEATAPKSGSSQPPSESTVPEPSESVPVNEVEQSPLREQAEDRPVVDEPEPPTSAVAAATETRSKGKAKDEPPPPASKPREADSLEIAPTDQPAPTAKDTEAGPVCVITLLLPTGARHPYRIDDKYLAKRNVDVPDVTESGARDPFSISVYKLKELILREWRDDWEGKPASPSSIRLIHFGKLLDDKEQLKKYNFTHDSPNVVHMSVRPPEMMEEEETGKSKSAGREGRSREGGGGCCVIL